VIELSKESNHVLKISSKSIFFLSLLLLLISEHNCRIRFDRRNDLKAQKVGFMSH
jgi:hypothetical protein